MTSNFNLELLALVTFGNAEKWANVLEQIMELMLEIVSRQKFTIGKGASYVFGEVGGYIGRGEECEWSLPDKGKQLSRKHALISCDGKTFFLEDISTNGIFTVLGKERLPKNTRVKIEHGASFFLGEFTIQARLLHKPEAYLPPSASIEADEIIPDEAFLALDPLLAMDQQDEIIAKNRLGIYNDLLGTTTEKPVIPSDHNESSIDSMLSVTAIPEDWGGGVSHTKSATSTGHDGRGHNTRGDNGSGQNRGGAKPAEGGPLASGIAPDDLDFHNNFSHQEQDSGGDRYAGVRVGIIPDANRGHRLGQGSAGAIDGQQEKHVHTAFPADFTDETERRVQTVPETDAFFTILGFTTPPATPEEREKVLAQAAELLLTAVDGMLLSLRNRADSKNDLRLPVTTMTLAGNNPLKFSPNAKAALEYLLAPSQEGMLPGPQAMTQGFSDLHSHHMGLLAGARAAVRAALGKIGPEQVELKLDADGKSRFNRMARLWNTYTHMHRRLLGDQEGFTSFFLHDFARAYEVQVRTLEPVPNRNRQQLSLTGGDK